MDESVDPEEETHDADVDLVDAFSIHSEEGSKALTILVEYRLEKAAEERRRHIAERLLDVLHNLTVDYKKIARRLVTDGDFPERADRWPGFFSSVGSGLLFRLSRLWPFSSKLRTSRVSFSRSDVGESSADHRAVRQPFREMTEIQRDDLVRLANQAARLKQTMQRLIAEIGRDHVNCDDETGWEIALGNRPSFVAFWVKGLLEVLTADNLDDLESELRKAIEMTDSQLQREWQDRQQAEEEREASQESIPGGHVVEHGNGKGPSLKQI